ncbi:MAG: hypothetical protein WBF81_07090, partial [Thermoplasmata archaeon]
MTIGVPSTRTSSPTASSVGEGTTQRTARVRARSTIDTATALSPSGTTHTVYTSFERALWTDSSERESTR